MRFASANDVPPFHVVKLDAVSVAGLYVPPVELRSQLTNLGICQRHHLVLTVSTGFGLPS